MAPYHQVVQAVDVAVGMIRSAVKEAGWEKNRVIIFTSDNGFFCGSHGYGSKVLPYEEATNVPLIIYDPRNAKKQRGKVAGQMALNTDIAPTILSYAGAKVPVHYQGHNLQPIVNGNSPNDWRKDTFCEHLMENAIIP